MKLSIITINYNNQAGLQRTIDSVLCQTWKDFEWIIIDGGSTDSSKELIDKYQKHFSYWCSEPDKGVYNAMNKGIEHASGDYLQFLNSGDSYHCADSLKQVFERWEDADIVYGDLNFMSEEGGVVTRYPEKLTLHYFLSHSIGHPASFIKSSLLKAKGYREDFIIVSDWYRFLEWFREGRSFSHLPVIVADYDTTGMSSVNLDQIERENEIVYKEVFGNANRAWIEESRQMQLRYEEDTRLSFQRIKACGGRRWSLLCHLMRLLNKTIK